MRVLILSPTRWDGESLSEGTEVTVELSVGQRWIRNGIAQAADEIQAQSFLNDQDSDEDEEIYGPVYASMKAKELYELCKERGITAETKQSAKYYIDLLIADDSKDDQVDLVADITDTDEVVNTADENADEDSIKE